MNPSVRTCILQQQVCRLLCHTPSCTIRRLRQSSTTIERLRWPSRTINPCRSGIIDLCRAQSSTNKPYRLPSSAIECHWKQSGLVEPCVLPADGSNRNFFDNFLAIMADPSTLGNS
ncbi:hypothetical protein PVK06_001913 [Gossypium arboreum]|uniref:Uncharacterized protein n=1 Tax=Gossypium arboreum TaxID=29729 RepID=A0ABR0R2I7_GOSAR|nr:hypothetical protein PVK06_001913 [Gossypium arboreum]